MAKKIKLHDRNGVQLIPVTRSTTVEMNDGLNLQTAYEGINSSHYTKAEINAAGYLQSFTETDPTVPSYVKGITETDITNWNSVKPKYIFTFEDNIGPVPTTEDYNSLSTRITNGEIVEGHTITLGSPNGAEDIYYLQSYNFSGGDFITFINGKGTRVLTFMNGGTPTVTSIDYITPTQLNNASYVSKAEINAAGYLTSHQNIKTINDNSILGTGNVELTGYNINFTNQNYTPEQLTNEYIEIGMSIDEALSELDGALYNIADNTNSQLSRALFGVRYDSTNRKIIFANQDDLLEELGNESSYGFYIDATDFIKDGMVDTAYVQGNNLVISFNTDAGKEAVNVPIADIFNANNYYTKSEIDNASYVQFGVSDRGGITSGNIAIYDNVYYVGSNDPRSDADGFIHNRINTTSQLEYDFEDNGLRLNGIFFEGSDINNWNSVANSYVSKTELNAAGYLTSFTETDPTVPSHVKSITQQNITDWNNKLSSETQLSKGTTTGSGNAVTDISVSNHQITLTKGSTFLTAHQDIKTINNNTLVGTGNVTINGLPTVTSSDNGKVLQVVNGVWTLVSPVTLYSGTGTPSNSQGNNGDLYMQI